MEASNTNNDFNHKPRIPYSENSSPRDGASSNNGNQWHESHRRDNGKNRERSRDGEWNRDRPFHGKNSENFRDEERERFKEQPQPQPQPQPQQQPSQQTSNFPAYGYNTSDHSYVDNNRRALSMMSTYNLIAAMNSQWGANPIDSMPMAQNNLPVNAGSSAMPMPTGIDMAQPSGSGMNPYAFMGMPGENMFGMMGMGNYCQYGMMNTQENVMIGPVKEVLQLSKCVLYPPSPTAPPPTIRPKPLGCKTVFVGGLPEKCSEEIMKEIFERCGEILTIRMSKKNFCHIRFANESFVENAMYFSGYKIKTEESGSVLPRLHVDYAEARDDQYEYECQQRALQREARHRERLEQEYYSPPTPPPVVHYSDHESVLLSEKLRGEETFQQAVSILITWLERGECSKRNAGSFYSMIQSTNSHVRRLMNEKLKFEDELEKARKMLQKNMHGILLQFNDIEKVFNAACLQKVWDHFTKAQRKNIEMWKKQTEEIKNAHVEEVLNDRIEDEMDLSDDDNEKEDNAAKKVLESSDIEKTRLDEFCKLREEIDALRCQLEAAENEVVVVQSEKLQELDLKERQIQAMRQILQSSKKEMKSLSQKRSFDEAELNEFRAYKSKKEKDDIKEVSESLELDNDNLGAVASTSSSMNISGNEARLIGLISTFLHVHPFGANIDYICSYLHQIDSAIKVRDVENLMKSFPTVFREDSTGIGASLGKKWRFLGFQS